MNSSNRLNILFLFVALLFTSAIAKSQDTLSLNRAIDIALKNSLDIQLSRNTIEAAGLLNSTAVAGGSPNVGLNITESESVSSVNQKLSSGSTIRRNNSAANSLGVGLTGSILLFNGGRVIAAKKRLGEIENQGRHRLVGQMQNTISDVIVSYYDIVRQQDYIKTIDRSIAASNQQLSIVKIRQSVGLANNADLFQAQIDLNALMQSKEAQVLIVAQAKAELLRILSLNADSSIAIRDTIIPDRSVVLQTVLNDIPKNADLIVAEDQIRINELLVRETNALRYPSVSALGGYNFTRNNAGAGQVLLNQNFGPTVGLSLGIPLFNGGLYRRQTEVARIDVRNANIQRSILLRDFNANAVKQFLAYTSTLVQIETEKATYSLSDSLLNLTLFRFELRQATILEVRDAQQSFEESGYRLVNLNYAAKVAETELKRLSNRLGL